MRYLPIFAWLVVSLAALQAPPVLRVTPSRLQFTADDRADLLPAQRVQITNAGGGEVVWHASATEPWLAVMPDHGLAPATLLVQVRAKGLRPGRYSGAVIVDAGNVQDSPQRVPVDVRITSSGPTEAPALHAVPDRVRLSTIAGDSAPATFALELATDNQADIRWTATSDEPWLTLSRQEGTGAAQVVLSASAAALAVGDHTATISISAGSERVTVPVVFVVLPGGGPLEMSATPMRTAVLNVPYSQPLPLRGGRPPYRTDIVSGQLPPDLVLSGNTISGVPRQAGRFSMTVTLSDSSDPPTTRVESVTILVTASEQTALVVDPATLAFTTSAGRSPAALALVIRSGEQPLIWHATADVPWLTIDPASGTAPAHVSVSAATKRLAPGSYTATIHVEMEGATNTPVDVPVRLVVK